MALVQHGRVAAILAMGVGVIGVGRAAHEGSPVHLFLH
jgi:hypothetical protein